MVAICMLQTCKSLSWILEDQDKVMEVEESAVVEDNPREVLEVEEFTVVEDSSTFCYGKVKDI
jgi:hypothetical protein